MMAIRTRLTLACLLVGLMAPARSSIHAQAPPGGDSGVDPGNAFISRGLQALPFTADAIGLSMHLPYGAHVTLDSSGSTIVYIATDAPVPKLWRIRLEQVPWANPQPDSDDSADAFLDLILSRQGEARVIVRGPMELDGRAGLQCYVERTFPDGTQAIHGWVLMPSAPGSFVIFTLSVTPEYFPDFKPLFDRSLATLDLRSEVERSLEHRSRIEHGRQFLQSLTAERLRPLIGLRQWFRSYRPPARDGSTGAVELACSVVDVFEAMQGELNGNRDEREFSPEDRELGLMVRVQGRMVIDASRDSYADTLAQYWMAWDQSGEAWSILTTQRQRRATRTEAETGLRPMPSVGQPQPKLTVIRSTDNPREWRVPEVYLSQSLAWLLGRLLPRDQQEPQFFSYYYYNARGASPTLTLRYDRWEPVADGSGNWVLATLLEKNQPPDMTTYDADGALLRRVRNTGDVTEPTTQDALLRLWRSKGLRTGTTRP